MDSMVDNGVSCDFHREIIELDKSLRLSKSTKNKLEKIHRSVMQDVVFSRFKYYTSKRMTRHKVPDSKYAIQTFKEGNCVAFAYYTQSVLKKHGFTKAVVVGSSPPKLFKRPGYKHISHAAVVLPYNRGYVIFDASFYYPSPVYVDVKAKTDIDQVLEVKNVYSSTTQVWHFNYISSENTDAYDASGGMVPMATPYLRAWFMTTEGDYDECRYYLREIKNADACITVHTNAMDRRIFYCKVTPALDIELYYAYDLNTPDNPRLKGRVLNKEIPSLNLVPGTTTRYDVEQWMMDFDLPKGGREHRKMRSNVLTFFDYYIDDTTRDSSSTVL